jgi:hypothetical protein
MDRLWDRWPITDEDLAKYRKRERERASLTTNTVKVSRDEQKQRKDQENAATTLEIPTDICLDTSAIEASAEAWREELSEKEEKTRRLDEAKSKVASIIKSITTKIEMVKYMDGKTKVLSHLDLAWSNNMTVEKMYYYIIELDKASMLHTTTTTIQQEQEPLPYDHFTLQQPVPYDHYTQQEPLSYDHYTLQQPVPIVTQGYYTTLMGSPIMPTQVDETEYNRDTPSTELYHRGRFSQLTESPTPSTHMYSHGLNVYSMATPATQHNLQGHNLYDNTFHNALPPS